MKKHLLYFLTFFAAVFITRGQTIDSLRKIISSGKNDTLVCSAYVSWGEEIYNAAPDSAILLWLKAKERVEFYLQKKPAPKIKIALLHSLSGALNNIGFIYSITGKSEKALQFYKQSLGTDSLTGDKKGIANTLINIGRVYDKTGNLPLALEYFLKGLKLEEETGDKNGQAYALNNLGFIYDSQGDTARALQYHYQSLKLRLETGDKAGAGQSYTNIGTIYHVNKQHEKALEFYYKGLKIREGINDYRGVANALSNIGSAYYSMGKDSLAMDFYNQSLLMRVKSQDKQGEAVVLNKIAGLYFLKNQNAKASELARRSLMISQEIGYPENIRNAAEQLYRIYKADHQEKNALDMFELFIVMRDSLQNESNKKLSIKKQFQYEYEKKAAADSVRAEQERKVSVAALQAEKTQFWFLICGLIFVSGGLFFVIYRFRESQKQKKIIEEQKKLAEIKQTEILDSIRYARRIQNALMPSGFTIEKEIKKSKS